MCASFDYFFSWTACDFHATAARLSCSTLDPGCYCLRTLPPLTLPARLLSLLVRPLPVIPANFRFPLSFCLPSDLKALAEYLASTEAAPGTATAASSGHDVQSTTAVAGDGDAPESTTTAVTAAGSDGASATAATNEAAGATTAADSSGPGATKQPPARAPALNLWLLKPPDLGGGHGIEVVTVEELRQLVAEAMSGPAASQAAAEHAAGNIGATHASTGTRRGGGHGGGGGPSAAGAAAVKEDGRTGAGAAAVNADGRTGAGPGPGPPSTTAHGGGACVCVCVCVFMCVCTVCVIFHCSWMCVPPHALIQAHTHSSNLITCTYPLPLHPHFALSHPPRFTRAADPTLPTLLRQPLVVQRYISNPKLFDGHKHDLRLFFLVTSLDPLVVWSYPNAGIVKFCSSKYSRDPADVKNVYIHLGNQCLNIHNPEFHQEEGEDGVGSRWSLGAWRARMEAEGFDIERIQERIDGLIFKVVAACQAQILAEMRRKRVVESQCYEVRPRTCNGDLVGDLVDDLAGGLARATWRAME